MKIISLFLLIIVLAAGSFYTFKIDGETDLNRKIAIVKSRIKYTLFTKSTTSAVSLILARKDGLIAHGGGSIEGQVYTNSLEALDKSYNDGFRLLELDLLMTRDNELVAVHDWGSWKKDSDYRGELPPTLDQFMRFKIKGKYTPLDITAINRWFARHEDAYLVTDKIADPSVVAKAFPFYKDRVYMELFTWDTYHKARELELFAPMINGGLLIKEPKAMEKVREFKIRYVSLSRKLVPRSLDLLESLVVQGAKVYLYHNDLDGHDEIKVLCKAADYVYGLYSDDIINKNFQCKK